MKQETTPVEQGARDAMQLAINALERARDSAAEFAMCDYIDTALLEIGCALAVQRAEQYHGMSTAEQQRSLKEHPSVGAQIT